MTEGQPESSTALDQDIFVAEFRRWRDVRGLSRSVLAQQMGYSRSYVSKIESGGEHASRGFAVAADTALNAGGAIRRAWRDQETTHPPKANRAPGLIGRGAGAEPAGGLLVEHDHAELRYDAGTYRATMRRKLINYGDHPITQYLIRISVDRFPGDPERSNQLYRDNPLTWEEIGLQAWCGENRAETMRWTVQHDRDAFKEVWLLFANDSGRFPLYPGETTWIEYSYTVGDDKWGHWFRRAVRLPTRQLSVTLDFPAQLDPAVWGLHTSMTAESMPFATAIQVNRAENRVIYSWSTDDPPLHARYRLEWHFRADDHVDQEAPPKPSETMTALGIVQQGDLILRRPARLFSLPIEAEDARRVISELAAAAQRVAAEHTFGKGMGIAAPQIGIERSAAIVRRRASDGQWLCRHNQAMFDPQPLDQDLLAEISHEIGRDIAVLNPDLVLTCAAIGNHMDHRLTRVAALHATMGRETQIFLWEDLPYAIGHPPATSPHLTRPITPDAWERKRRAITRYTTQVRMLWPEGTDWATQLLAHAHSRGHGHPAELFFPP